jgi:beta-phosphoglucomutase-like phosphatase (HAD superfamily)
MKPHPHSLLRALDEIGAVDRESCVLVGDSLDDARAAVSAGIGFIGYVHPSVQAGNGRGRYRVEQQSEALRAAGARVVVSELRTLVREMH